MSFYHAVGNKVVLEHRVAAVCNDAPRAVKLLNRARDLNDRKRRYTAAARLIAEAETLDGFEWTEPGTNPTVDSYGGTD